MRTAKPERSKATKESRANSGAVPGAFERGFIAGTEAQRAITADAIRQTLRVGCAYQGDPELIQCLETLRRFLP